MSRARACGLKGTWLPGCTMFEHGVQYGQELAHAGGQGHLLRLAGRQEPLIEGPDHGVEAGGYQGGHIEGRPHGGPSAPDGAPASQGTAVPVDRQSTRLKYRDGKIT